MSGGCIGAYVGDDVGGWRGGIWPCRQSLGDHRHLIHQLSGPVKIGSCQIASTSPWTINYNVSETKKSFEKAIM
jgi:hypothetical protein